MRPNSRKIASAISQLSHQPSVVRSSACGIRWSTSHAREWSTPLAKSLAEAIATTGPIPVAAYMRQCLTSASGGYYTSRPNGHDQFGQKGDFITSPEISQVFGELVGVWVVAEWMSQGKRSSGIHLMEVGPGRGTLMDDMLRTVRNFKDMAASIEAIYMVEASPSLRDAQKKLLCGDTPMEEIDIGFRSSCKYLKQLKIIWCEDIRLVPKDSSKSPFIIAHEFFDALPIHIFQNVPRKSTEPSITTSTTVTPRSRVLSPCQWRELVISPTPPSSIDSTLPIQTSLHAANRSPEFQLTVSSTVTPHSMYLPETSARYKALASTPGSIIEISPESLSYASEFAIRIGGAPASTSTSSIPSSTKPTPSGAALIIDYGPSATIPTNSLRGIQAHRIVSPFSSPGQVDLSADVDFMALAEAAINASPAVEVHGPVEQGVWLSAMGIKERAEMLLEKAKLDIDAQVNGEREQRLKCIESGWKRLVDRGPTGMGRIYKVMAIVPYYDSKRGRRPVGFGGDVTM